jgi:hypothetical protein
LNPNPLKEKKPNPIHNTKNYHELGRKKEWKLNKTQNSNSMEQLYYKRKLRFLPTQEFVQVPWLLKKEKIVYFVFQSQKLRIELVTRLRYIQTAPNWRNMIHEHHKSKDSIFT